MIKILFDNRRKIINLIDFLMRFYDTHRYLICISTYMEHMKHQNRQKIKAIVFDCDGTLIDSEEAHYLAWKKVTERLRCELCLSECIGGPDTMIAKIVIQRLGHGSPDALLAEKRDNFQEFFKIGFPPIHGTLKFVQQLINEKKKLGLKLAVASAAEKFEIVKHLKNLKIDHGFDSVLSGHDDLGDYQDPEGVNKPKPYIYLQTAKLLGVLPSECIVIEDSIVGVTASKTAGCITVAVPNVVSNKQDFSNAALTLNSLGEFTIAQFMDVVLSAAEAQKLK